MNYNIEEMKTDEYNNGFNAYNSGIQLVMNPWMKTDKEYSLWYNGWMAAYNSSINDFRNKFPTPTVPVSSFIGLTLEEANKNSGGWWIYTSNIDGRSIPQSSSLMPLRVCVKVTNDKIVAIESYGS